MTRAASLITLALLLVALVVWRPVAAPSVAQDRTAERLAALETRVADVETRLAALEADRAARPGAPAAGEPLTGSGNQAVTVHLTAGLHVVAATTTGQLLAIAVYDAAGALVAVPLVVTAPQRDGSAALTIPADGDYTLNVQSDGDWTITIA